MGIDLSDEMRGTLTSVCAMPSIFADALLAKVCELREAVFDIVAESTLMSSDGTATSVDAAGVAASFLLRRCNRKSA